MSQTRLSRSVLVFGWTMALLPMVALFLFSLYILGTVTVATVWYSSPIVLVTQTTQGQLLERRVLKTKRTSGEFAPWGRQEQWDAEGKLVKSVPFFLSSNRLHGRIFDRLIQPDRAMLTPGSSVFSGHVIELQPNGVLARTANFQDGKLHGEEITQHPHGGIATKGSYNTGNRDGLWQEWNASGMLVVRGTYLAGLKNGWWDEWDDVGTLRRSVDMLDDLPCGWTIEWRPNGTIASRCVYAEGKKHGLWEEWREDGSLACRGVYVWDEQTGLWEYWYETGVYQKTVALLKGIQEGPETVWFKNGSIASRGSYTAGKRSGRWEVWYPSGLPQRTVDLLDNVRHGEETIWYEDGRMTSHGSYVNGQKNGDWDYWNEDGIHIRREQWKDGQEDGIWLVFKSQWSQLFERLYKAGKRVDRHGKYLGRVGIDGYLRKQAEEERQKEETRKLIITLLICVPIGAIGLALLSALLGGGSAPAPYPSSHSSGRTTRLVPRESVGGISSSALGSSSVYVPPLPPGRTIPTVPWVRYTPSGEVQTDSGSALGRIDPATGNVVMPAGHIVGNVKDVKNPDEAAARAYRMIDDDAC